MTPAQALARLRALQAAADADWPLGWDFAAILPLAVEAVQVLDGAARTPAEARAFVARLQEIAA